MLRVAADADNIRKRALKEREEAIREELIARQTRIEELQLRLQQSERRAKTSSVAAAKEAETQKELMKEIEEQERRDVVVGDHV